MFYTIAVPITLLYKSMEIKIDLQSPGLWTRFGVFKTASLTQLKQKDYVVFFNPKPTRLLARQPLSQIIKCSGNHKCKSFVKH